MAQSLTALGIAPGDRALLVFPFGLSFVCSFWACLFAGVVAVPLYPVSRTNLRHDLIKLGATAKDCAPKAVITDAPCGDPPSHPVTIDFWVIRCCALLSSFRYERMRTVMRAQTLFSDVGWPNLPWHTWEALTSRRHYDIAQRAELTHDSVAFLQVRV